MTAPTFAMVKIAAHGRWPEILAALGIDPAALRNRHGPCPGCGGRDRFRFDDNGNMVIMTKRLPSRSVSTSSQHQQEET